MRDPPCTERQEYREHNRKLFRQIGHCQRNSSEQAVHPVAARIAVQNRYEHAQHQSDHGENDYRTSGFPLDAAQLGNERLQCLADFADLGVDTRGDHARQALSLSEQRSEVDEGQIVPSGACPLRVAVASALAHGHRFAGK